jgi:hypothetical protein
VRAAVHGEQDACLIEELDARLDRAAEQGWRYSDADWVLGWSRDGFSAKVGGILSASPLGELADRLLDERR